MRPTSPARHFRPLSGLCLACVWPASAASGAWLPIAPDSGGQTPSSDAVSLAEMLPPPLHPSLRCRRYGMRFAKGGITEGVVVRAAVTLLYAFRSVETTGPRGRGKE